MSGSENKKPIVPGLLLVLAGVALNQRSLAHFFSKDGLVQSTDNLWPIWSLQAGLIVLGLLVMTGALNNVVRGLVVSLLTLIGLVGIAGGVIGWLGSKGYLDSETKKAIAAQIARVDNSETLHLNLGSERLGPFNKSLENLRVPSGVGLDVVSDEVLVVDLVGGQTPKLYKELPTVDTQIFKWKVESEGRKVKKEELTFLSEFLDDVEYLKSGSKVYFVGGDFVGDDLSQWEVRCGFKAMGHKKDGRWVKASGHLVLRWELAEGKDPSNKEDFQDYYSWTISQIRLQDFKSYETTEIFFTEELDRAITDPSALAAARRNIAQEGIVEMMQYEAEHGPGSWERPHEFWGHQASWRHPSVSVVDLDRDGFDDFYAMARYGKNMFFRNNGDGTFSEQATELGLDIEDHSGVAIFADFDNDADDDVFIGRTIGRSTFRTNEDGRFVETNENFGRELPYFASTASAVDYDQDGLLDLYVGTYAAQLLNKDADRKRSGGGKIEDKALLAEYLPIEEARVLFQLQKVHRGENVRDRIGPPNLLMRNTGNGHFELASDPMDNISVDDSGLTHTGQPERNLGIWRNTFQSTFSDYDDDGDQDVYIANDYAPNHMFRNDGGTFVDVTEASNARDIGFGMGVSWGDYDKDGDFDAYISNMFSKAGNRILPMVDVVDSDFLQMASGNSLLELQDGRFERVSTTDESKPGGKMLEMANWSWGSQWVDVDNDSWLDAYAVAGYYSAPKEIRAGHDL